MHSASRKINLPDVLDSLFSTDDIEEEPINPKENSDEFNKLLQEQEEKQARRKKKSKTVGASNFDRTTQETREMIETQEWDNVTPRHLVALYSIMHVKCYGIECTELDSKERYKACNVAKNFVEREFGGDIAKVVEYFRWIWTREIKSVKWKVENNREVSFRISPYYMFSQRLLNDFRLALAQRRQAP